MIEFYHMVADRVIPFEELDVHEVGNLSCICLVDILNSDKKIVALFCNYHPDFKQRVALLYTDNKIEFIVTEYCCEIARVDLAPLIQKLEMNLAPFWQ
jgi:hypothetical protein